MKSKKAEAHMDSKVEEVDDVVKFGAPKLVVRLRNAIYSVELAEQETEERMRDKAIKAYCSDCCCSVVGTCGIGTENCIALRNFIQKLDEE